MKTLTLTQLVERTVFKRETIRQWCSNGYIRATKIHGIWTVEEADLEAFLEAKKKARAKFNQSSEAAAKVKAKIAAGTLSRITPEVMERAEQAVIAKQERLAKLFPNPKPGEIYEYLLNEMEQNK